MAEQDNLKKLDENDKLLLDILHKEREHCRDDSAKTNDYVFRLITIALIPFLLVIGYTIYLERFRFLVITIPVMSILGIFLIANVFQRYTINSLYKGYLERRIKKIIGERYLLSRNIHGMFFGRPYTLVFTTLYICSAIVLTLNLLIFPSINIVLQDNPLKCYFQNYFPNINLVRAYWIFISILFIYLIACLVIQFCIVTFKVTNYIKDFEAKHNRGK